MCYIHVEQLISNNEKLVIFFLLIFETSNIELFLRFFSLFFNLKSILSRVTKQKEYLTRYKYRNEKVNIKSKLVLLFSNKP